MTDYLLKLAIVLPPTAVVVYSIVWLLSWIWPLLLVIVAIGTLCVWVSIEPGLPKSGKWPGANGNG